MILSTARLVLRSFRADDVDAFATFAHAEEYRRYLGDDHPDPATFVASNVGLDGAWVIELDERIVGSIFLGEELAFLLDPRVHGQGIATEAARAVITDGFDRRGYAEIVARADPANARSLRAMARLGFVGEGCGTHRLRRSSWSTGAEPPSA